MTEILYTYWYSSIPFSRILQSAPLEMMSILDVFCSHALRGDVIH